MKTVQRVLNNTQETLSPLPDVYDPHFHYNAKKNQWNGNVPTDEGLIDACSKAEIVNLTLKGGDISAKAFRILLKEPLRRLVLESVDIDAEKLKTISQMSGLENLQFYKANRLNDALLTNLTGPRNLRELSFRDTLVTAKGLADIPQLFPELESIWFVRNQFMSNEAVRHIDKLKKLGRMFILECGVNGRAFKYIAKCKMLKHLELASTSFTVQDLKEFRNSSLTALVLRNCQVSSECLETVSGIKTLKDLALRDCSGITYSDIREFETKYPRIKVFWTQTSEPEQ
ncbi:MAG: hypothetical protein K2Z81_01425 [Cyanobacteria bacterium]|nr:hypothetical protein [Cyanobacteriota bacterium]